MLESFWNEERPRSDALPPHRPEPRSLLSTPIHERPRAPESPVPSVLGMRACPQRPGVAVNQPGFARESPVKIFQRMKASRDQVQTSPLKNMALWDSCDWDILLTPYYKTRDSSRGIDPFQKNNCNVTADADEAGDPNNAPSVEGPGPRITCHNPAGCKPSPLKLFLRMKAAALRRQKPGGEEDAENAVPGGGNRVSSLQAAHGTWLRRASDVPGAEDEAAPSSCFASPDPAPEEKEKGNEADDEMSQNSQTGTLAGDTASPDVCRPPSLVFKSIVSKAGEKDRCPILNSPLFRVTRTSKDKRIEDVVSGPDTNARNPKRVMALREWVVKQLPDGGVCVEGKRVEMPDLYWHSSVVVERLGSNRVKTLSGQIYELRGRADLDTMKQAGFPSDLIQKFQAGFPADWKTLDAFFKKANRNKIPKTGQNAKPKHKKLPNPSQQSAKTQNPGNSEAPHHETRWKRGNAPLSKEPASLPSSRDSSSQDDSEQPEGIDDATYTIPRDDQPRRHRQSSTAWKKPEASTPSSSPAACSGTVSRSGRTIKPVLKYWCGERLVINNDFEITMEEGRENQLCVDSMVKENPLSRRQPKPHNVSTAPARATCDLLLKPESETDIEKCKRHLPQVMVTPLTKPQLKAKCKHHNLNYESAEVSYRHSVALPASVSQSPGPNLRVLRETTRLRGKVSPPSSSEEAISSSSSSSEDTKEAAKRSRAKSEKRRFQKTGQPRRKPSARGTPDSLRGLASAGEDSAPRENKAGHAETDNRRSGAENGDSRRTSSRNTMSSADPSDSDAFCGGRYARESLRTNGDRQPSPSRGPGDKWTETEIERLVKAVTMLGRQEKWSWKDVAKRVQTRTARACQNKYRGWQKTEEKGPPKKKPNAKQNHKEVLDLKDLKITGKVGTLKRKKQMMTLLDHLPKDDCDDMFSSTPYRGKRVKLPSMNLSSDNECSLDLEECDPTTPTSSIFPFDATPNSDYLTPGMLKHVDRSTADLYMYRYQKATKRNFLRCEKVNKKQAGQSHTTPVSRRTSSRNDHLNTNLGKLFQAGEPDTSGQEEEEDYYFGSSP